MYKFRNRNLFHNHFPYCTAAGTRWKNIFIQNCVTQICIMKKSLWLTESNSTAESEKKIVFPHLSLFFFIRHGIRIRILQPAFSHRAANLNSTAETGVKTSVSAPEFTIFCCFSLKSGAKTYIFYIFPHLSLHNLDNSSIFANKNKSLWTKTCLSVVNTRFTS